MRGMVIGFPVCGFLCITYFKKCMKLPDFVCFPLAFHKFIILVFHNCGKLCVF